ncbi:Na/Pi symporter [Bdellovibrio sp. ArHS]|uniref:Na/Pi cotransporter family protein n=1 Tax=Bdellovibrio sp. ArHS TaxID=1569284 RepID=UPI000B27A7DF|nr:Na/Pi symporter [Bdellovibrio sp. ArHS]
MIRFFEQQQIIFSIVSAIILFLYGLSAFSNELKQKAGNKLESTIRKLTANRFMSFLVGLFSTATIQSSTAVSILAVSLVDSGMLSFPGAVAVMLGSHIGTTLTAWMVSFKLTGIGPVFIVLGSLLAVLPWRAKIFGKALFYFGFIFFSLDLVSSSLQPLRQSQYLADFLLYTNTPLKGILAGTLLTALMQSSTVVTGLAIIFVQQDLISPEASIPIVLGANIGTTVTGLYATYAMNWEAKKAAWSNTIINTLGVILLYPFIDVFTSAVMALAPNDLLVVAIAHLGFNICLVSIFLTLLRPFTEVMDKIFKQAQKSDLKL